MITAISQIYGLMKMAFSIFNMIKGLMNEYENKKAEEKRTKLNSALDELQKASSDQEKKDAIKKIASNTF